MKPRKLQPALLVAHIAILSLFVTGCKTRKSTFSSEGAAKGLDAMDVAFLFPSPLLRESKYPAKGSEAINNFRDQLRAIEKLKPLEAAGYWAPLAQGQGGPVSDALLEQVFAPIKGTSDRGYGKGIFRFDQTIGTPEEGQFVIDMSALERWRIVAYRFHPCPMEHEQKKQSRGPESCTPEVRLVAQPILGKDPLEAEFASQLPLINTRNGNGTNFNRISMFMHGYRFGDYGMHVFYRLKSNEEAKLLAQQLLDLKNARGERECNTTDVEVGVHPCLEFEANQIYAGSFAGNEKPFARELKEIFGSHMHTLHKISVWGSTQNAGPWGFYQGEVENNSTFKWKPIVTVQKKSFANIQKVNPFDDGFAMQYTRGASINGPVIGGGARGALQASVISDTKTLRPDPLVGNDNLQFYLLNQLRFNDTGTTFTRVRQNRMDDTSTVDLKYRELKSSANLSENIAQVGRYIPDLAQMVERIDNPKLNHEFKVDCVSCHMSRSENTFVSTLDKKAFFGGMSISNRNEVLEKLDKTESYPWQVQLGAEPIAGVVDYTSSRYQKHVRGRFGEVYMLNQFSYYFDMAVVSNRAAHEIADSARFANETLLQLGNPGGQRCNRTALKACLLSDESAGFNPLPYKNEKTGRCEKFMCSAEDSQWSFASEQKRVAKNNEKKWEEFLNPGLVGLFVEGSPAVDLKKLAKRLAEKQKASGIVVTEVDRAWTSARLPVAKSGEALQIEESLNIVANPLKAGNEWKIDLRHQTIEKRPDRYPLAISSKAMTLKGDSTLVDNCYQAQVETLDFKNTWDQTIADRVLGTPESFEHKVGSMVQICLFKVSWNGSFLTLIWDNGQTNAFFEQGIHDRESADKEFAKLTLPAFLSREDVFKRLRAELQ
jgi:hypothetical protein